MASDLVKTKNAKTFLKKKPDYIALIKRHEPSIGIQLTKLIEMSNDEKIDPKVRLDCLELWWKMFNEMKKQSNQDYVDRLEKELKYMEDLKKLLTTSNDVVEDDEEEDEGTPFLDFSEVKPIE